MRSLRSVIGVDIGGRTIKVAQVAGAGRKRRAFALQVRLRPETGHDFSGAEAVALRDQLRRQGFAGRRIVISVPQKALLRAAMELPSRVVGAPAEQIVRMELSRLHNIAPDSFEMARWDLADASGAKPVTHTLAVGYPHDAANAYLDVFEEAGFQVVALDVHAAAIARACMPLVLPSPQLTAIADLGWDATSVLFTSGSSLVYERSLRGSALSGLVSRLTDVFKIPFDVAYRIVDKVGPAAKESTEQLDYETLDAIRKYTQGHFDKLIEELRIPLSYANHHFPGDGVKRLLLIGGGAAVPELVEYFGGALGIEVKMARPSDLLECPSALLGRANNAALTPAVGLALFGGGR